MKTRLDWEITVNSVPIIVTSDIPMERKGPDLFII